MQSSTQIKYDEYINSSAWTERKEGFFLTHSEECSACGNTNAVDLHHKTYTRLGLEDDNDLVALCKTCHAQYHAIFLHTSVTDSENFVAVKHASQEGKKIFRQYKYLIDEMFSAPMKEYTEKMLLLRTIMNNPKIEHELRPAKEKERIKSFAGKIGMIFNSFLSNCSGRIIELDNPEIGTSYVRNYMTFYLDVDGQPDLYGESKRYDLFLLLKYRWLLQELVSLVPYELTLSELQKIKKVLIQDDINECVVASGYREKKTGFWSRFI